MNDNLFHSSIQLVQDKKAIAKHIPPTWDQRVPIKNANF